MWPWHNHGLSSLPALCARLCTGSVIALAGCAAIRAGPPRNDRRPRKPKRARSAAAQPRSEEHTSELQSPDHLVCRLLLEKKKKSTIQILTTERELHKRITK